MADLRLARINQLDDPQQMRRGHLASADRLRGGRAHASAAQPNRFVTECLRADLARLRRRGPS